MTPLQLYDLCVEAVERWKLDPLGIRDDKPFILLTVTRQKCPSGNSARVFGKTGPLGRICNVKQRADGKFDVTGYWPVEPILRQLIDAFATPIKETR